MNTCIQCKHFNFREAGGMAQHGFGWCPLINHRHNDGTLSRSKTRSGHATACEKFEAAPTDQVQERQTWLAKKRAIQ